jgi:hypothetical protein
MDELWSSDYEVLHWLVERFERSGQRIKEHEIFATFPEDRHDDVRQSLRRLATHGYIDGARSGGGLGGHADVVHDVVGVHERALRAVGAWPDNAEVLADRMLAVLAERAANEPDPARRSKFATGLKGVGGMTRDLLVEVAGSVISKSAPVPLAGRAFRAENAPPAPPAPPAPIFGSEGADPLPVRTPAPRAHRHRRVSHPRTA